VITLAISTASPALSLALFDGDALVARDHRSIGRGHAEALVPGIAALVEARRRAVRQPPLAINAIIVDIGPGSFTGIRIGIAAARALGLAWQVPVTGCIATALVAAQAFAARPHLAAVTVLLDAGRGQVLRQRIGADHAATPIETLAAADIRIAADEATAGDAAPADRGDRVHAGHPDAAFAMQLPPPARGLAPRAVYLRPADAMLPP
jgi:tRNA threonylcarbamoyladenosine biosynthesis protein TsaB